jgi:hypothetical protein
MREDEEFQTPVKGTPFALNECQRQASKVEAASFAESFGPVTRPTRFWI